MVFMKSQNTYIYYYLIKVSRNANAFACLFPCYLLIIANICNLTFWQFHYSSDVLDIFGVCNCPDALPQEAHLYDAFAHFWCLIEFDWIKFEVVVLAYRCLQWTAPPYFGDKLHQSTNSEAQHHLHFASLTFLIVHSIRLSTICDLAFPITTNNKLTERPFSRTTRISPYQSATFLDSIVVKGDGGGGNNWSEKTCEAPFKLPPPTCRQPTF